MAEKWAPHPPPSPRRSRYDWVEITRELRARADTDEPWLLVDKKANISTPSAVAGKRMLALRDPEWDYKVRQRKTDRARRTCEMWMRAVRKEG